MGDSPSYLDNLLLKVNKLEYQPLFGKDACTSRPRDRWKSSLEMETRAFF